MQDNLWGLYKQHKKINNKIIIIIVVDRGVMILFAHGLVSVSIYLKEKTHHFFVSLFLQLTIYLAW